MSNDCKRAIAVVQRAVLVKNLDILAQNSKTSLVRFQGAIAMLKANAYGHGLVESARAFLQSKNCHALGIADFLEGIELRNSGIKKPIWIFSGQAPLTDEVISQCRKFQLTPILSNVSDIQKYSRAALRKDTPRFHIKINTGMNRLGVEMSELGEVIKVIKSSKNCEGICTHFAQALLEDSALTRKQIRNFQFAYSLFSHFNIPQIHAANSAAVLNQKLLKQIAFTNIVRPGIGLYGYADERGIRAGLKPALKLKAKVIQSRTLKKDDLVGYDGTFKAHSSTNQSVLALGYGDGFHRILSNQKILIRNKTTQILGRVSMDMLSINAFLKIGSWVTILGDGHKQMEIMANQAETISYEILTSLTSRVLRQYK